MGGSLEISFPMRQYKRFYVYCEPGIFGSCGGKLTLLAEFADFFSSCFYVVLVCGTKTRLQSKVQILYTWGVKSCL